MTAFLRRPAADLPGDATGESGFAVGARPALRRRARGRSLSSLGTGRPLRARSAPMPAGRGQVFGLASPRLLFRRPPAAATDKQETAMAVENAWTQAEEAQLIDDFRSGIELNDIAATL